jgi:hypothetical protein
MLIDESSTVDTVAVLPCQPRLRRADPMLLAGGVVSVGLVLFFILLIHNRYLPIQEGWFSYYAYLMHQGKFPYRDFYFFTQPISLLISQAIFSFGDKFIYFRYYGIAEHTALTLALYYLLSRYFSVAAAVCGTVGSIFLFTSYCTDALFSYLYTCLLFLVMALIYFQRAYTGSPKRQVNLMIAGCFCALSFLSKQSNGLFGAGALVLAAAVLNTSFKNTLKDWLHLAAGALLGCLPVAVWLWWGSAWPAYLDQVYRGAAASKGSLAPILFGFYSRVLSPFALTIFAVLLLTGALLYRRRAIVIGLDSGLQNKIFTWVVMGAMVAAVVGGIVLAPRFGNIGDKLIRWSSRQLVFMVFYTTAGCFIWILWCRFVRRRTDWLNGYELPVILLLVSFFWSYSCGLSYLIEEQSAVPIVGLIIAFCYDKVTVGGLWTGRKVVICGTMCLVIFSIWHKWNLAFDWTSWRSSAWVEGKHSHWKAIADYNLDSETATMYDEILDDVARNIKAGDEIVTFPFTPMFNVITRNPQPTFAAVHYWDVCPNYIAAADAQRVKAARPKMIINVDPRAWVWRDHEEGFRRGRPSGQREFQNVIDTLAASGDYQLIRWYLTPFYEDAVHVWLRTR